jgi:hypothetical protein
LNPEPPRPQRHRKLLVGLAIVAALAGGFVIGHGVGSRSGRELALGTGPLGPTPRPPANAGEAQRPSEPSSPSPTGPTVDLDEERGAGEGAAPGARRAGTPSNARPGDGEPSIGPFDIDAAASSLASLSEAVRRCNATGAGGVARIAVTFAPSGRVTQSVVQGPPFAGTASASCMALALRSAKAPPFEGGTVTVRKSVPML